MSTPARETRGYSNGLAVFAAVFYVALLVAGFGFLSLLLNEEVIDQPDAGPIVGPFMAAVASALLLYCLMMLGRRIAARPSAAMPIGWAVLISIGCGVAWIISGAVSYRFDASASQNFSEFALHNAFRPFVLVVVFAALALTLIYSLLVIRRVHGSRRPSWPWEKDTGD